MFALRRGLLDEDITLARAGTKFSSLAAATSSVKPLFLQQPSQQQQQQQQQPPFVSNNFPPFNRSPLLSVPEHSTPNSFQQQPLQSQSAVQLNPNARSFTPRSDTNGTASTSVAVVTASDALLMQQKLVQKQEELMRRIAEQEAKQKEVVERRKIEHQQQLLFQQQQQQQKQQEESAAQAAAAAAQAAAAQAAVSMERIAQETAAAEAERQRRRFSLETREAERTRSHLQHTQMKQEMEQRRLERHDFTVQYTQHIIHTMAEQVVHEELMEILADVTADVNWRTLQSVYRMIVYEILDEDIVPRMTRELVYDEAAEFCFRAREARAKAAVVSRWRARLASIYESRRRELEALQLRAVKFYLDALGMESAPPIISGGGGDSMGNNKVVQPHPYYQSEYAHLAFSKVDTQYLSNLPKIDLASNLAPIIAKSQSAATSGRGLSFGMMDLHWKLVVSLPNGHSSSISRNNYNNSRPRTTSSNDLVELADEFCRRWIKTKLSSSEGTGNNQLGLSSEFETILKKTHALVSSTGSSSGPSLSNRRLLRILVQCVKSVSNTNNQTHQLDVKENAFAPCSGISAAVFQFSFVDTASQFK